MKRLGLLIAASIVVAGCYTGPGVDHYSAVLDGVTIPSDWQLVKTVLRGPGQDEQCEPATSSECPASIRYYVASDDPLHELRLAEDFATKAGFEVSQRMSPGCDLPTSFACAFVSARADDSLLVTIYRAPSDVYALKDIGLDGTTVQVEATGLRL